MTTRAGCRLASGGLPRVFAAVCAAWVLSPAAAQGAELPADAPAVPGGALSVDAEMRFRGANGDNLGELGKTWASQNSGWFQRSRLGIGLRRDKVNGYLQVQSSSALGAASPGSDPMPLGLQQGWLRAQAPLKQELWLDVGRFQLEYGAARHIGHNDFDAVGQAFDGVRGHFAIERRLVAEAFAAQLRPAQTDADVRRVLSGAHVSATPSELLLAQLYVLALKDNTQAQKSTLLTMGSRLLVGRWLGLQFEGEAAVQVGESKHTDASRATDRLAWMAATEVSYQSAPAQPLTVAAFAHMFSGDDDQTDAVDRAWQPLYPSKDQIVGLLRMFDITNLAQVGGRVGYHGLLGRFPVWARADIRQTRAGAGGAMPSRLGGTVGGSSGWKALGHEVDVGFGWEVLPGSELQLAGAWFGGSTLTDLPAGTAPLPQQVLLALLQWTSRL